jgi:diguanylate cyclase (GGDEF)-like protein
MLKAKQRSFARRHGPSLLLALFLLVQLGSLSTTLGADLRDGYVRTMLMTDVLATATGLAMFGAMRRTRTQRRARPARSAAAASAVPQTPSNEAANSASSTSARNGFGLAMPQAADELAPSAECVAEILEQLAHQAQHDSLTGLPNRSLAMDRLQQAIHRAERQRHSVAVMFLDLNAFKPLNDTYGHEFGDKVLRKTAERLQRSEREVDTVARLGGDEFLIIMEQIDQDKAMETAQVLSTIVRQPVAGKQGPVSVGMSSGVAMYPLHGTTARQLLRAADVAMYRSKRADGQPILAEVDAANDHCASTAARFNETTGIHLTMLDTWEGTLRGLRALSED